MLICTSIRRKLCLFGVLLLITGNKSVLANAAICFPDRNLDETRYSNGTVVGKYNYIDREGNPVHLRYFADESSYGLELNSVKISKPQPVPPKSSIKNNNKKGETEKTDDLTNFEILTEQNITVNKIEPSLLVDKDNVVVDNDIAARALGVRRKRFRRHFKKRSRSLHM